MANKYVLPSARREWHEYKNYRVDVNKSYVYNIRLSKLRECDKISFGRVHVVCNHTIRIYWYRQLFTNILPNKLYNKPDKRFIVWKRSNTDTNTYFVGKYLQRVCLMLVKKYLSTNTDA